MINVLLNGCNGKMGQELAKTINCYNDLLLACGFDRENNGKFTFPLYTKIEEIKTIPDVIIDFSVPVATFNILEYAKQNKIPIVIATTGFSNEELEKINKYSKYIPIFRCVNMSFEINLMAKILSLIAPVLKDNDIEIIETHHNRKIDSPSGTAILLADKINQSLGNTHTYELNRHNKKEKRSKNEIGFSSVRGGNIVGEHTVQFFGVNETFEIKHTAYSRTVFADGALKAAIFIVKQQPGLYSMDDLIGKTNATS